MTEENKEVFNPQITDFVVGIRSPRTIKVYPMSLGDQKKALGVIQQLLTEFSNMDTSKLTDSKKENKEAEDKTMEEFGKVIEVIQENITEILKFATDESDKVDLDEMTNQQFSDLIVLIYDTNFGGMVKNFQGLLGKVKPLMSMVPGA